MSSKIVIIGYDILCDETLNPPEAVARNEYRAKLIVHYIEVPEETHEWSDNDIRSNGGVA